MSRKQKSTLNRQLQNLEKEIRAEREKIRECAELARTSKTEEERLQLQTQKASHEASVRVLDEDYKETVEILKNLDEREADFDELRKQIEDEMAAKFERLKLEEARREGAKTKTGEASDMEKMIGGLMRFASSLDEAAGRFGRESDRPGGGEGRAGVGQKKTLGSLPAFTAGTSDFILHLRSFKDYVSINEISDEGKVKRLFLNTFDQVSRMRCTGIDPSLPPHNTSTLTEFYNAVRDLFIPKSEMQILRQAFYDHRQGPKALAMDFMMEKWSKYKRAWDRAPFSFFFENCTTSLYNEDLRQEVFRKVIDCDDPADDVAMSASFAEYVQHVQESIAYVRRVLRQGNPDHLGLAVVGQSNEDVTQGSKGSLGVREMVRGGNERHLEQMDQDEEDDDSRVRLHRPRHGSPSSQMAAQTSADNNSWMADGQTQRSHFPPTYQWMVVGGNDGDSATKTRP